MTAETTTPDPLPGASPMVARYAAIKAANPDCVLLYRVGEFYEILQGDAKLASDVLGLQLTRRRQKDSDDVPMCGIPAGSLAGMAARLLRHGRKVLVSEQAETPEGERPSRLLTPGTVLDGMADDRANHVALVDGAGGDFAVAWMDASSGEFFVAPAKAAGVGALLAKIRPSEVVVARDADAEPAVAAAIRESGAAAGRLRAPIRPADAPQSLAEFFGFASPEAFGGMAAIEFAACVGLLSHVGGVLGVRPDGVMAPRRMAPGETMEIDAATMRNLDVLASAAGPQGSLLSVLDRCVTAAGKRLLAKQVAAPLTDPRMLARRLETVRQMVGDAPLRGRLRDGLGGLPDLLRAVGRLSLDKGGPRDLAAVRDGLKAAAEIGGILSDAENLSPGLGAVARQMSEASSGGCADLAANLGRMLAADPPARLEDGGFVAEGADGDLDRLRAELRAGEGEIAALQARYAAETGVKTLKIRANGAIGHHVEVPNAAAAALTRDTRFVLRQGLSSASRYTTADLDGLASALEGAADRAAQREKAIYADLRGLVAAAREPLRRIAHAAAALDLVVGLGQAAAEGLWAEPSFTSGRDVEIVGGRHPVAEALLQADGVDFVPNDCAMHDGNRLWLLTGPNMAGKTTLLKQVALITLMAQIGSFVPADSCRLGIVDKLFSRIGAADDLATGRSTFMVEMLETAAILNQATERSLVILDEIGRGTSTHDGIAIAQASMEHLALDIGCRTLFATHYHELADTAENLPGAVCMAMEEGGGGAFTHRVGPGKAGRSHGLKVAKMAGMPRKVLDRAETILADLHGEAAEPQGPAPRRP